VPQSDEAETRLRELFAAALAAPATGKGRFDAVTTELYRAYAHDVVAIAKRRRVLESRIDDVSSATWADVPKALERFKGEGAFYSWLAGIATNKARDECRRAERHRYVRISESLSSQSRPSGVQVAGPSAEHPSRKVARTEALRRILEAFALLDADDEDLLLRHYETDEKAADIARALGLEPATVRQRLVRARARVLKHLQTDTTD
jgi:RNA polymerase sigma-70 factor (ECF subfamily)